MKLAFARRHAGTASAGGPTGRRAFVTGCLAFGCACALSLAADPSTNRFSPEVERYLKTFQSGGALTDSSKPLTPAETLQHFKLAPGLRMEVVSAEPTIRQPLNLHFDERGRLWVVQYLQYPFPAGLKVVKYDQYLRAVFDQVPPPPPNHIRGADRITILESSRGDGVFDRAKDFVSDLNIARSVVCGRGGVWILNPPYLLFYPDKDRDDLPDGPPEVVLSGFGLEDTHSGANSLAWGPDGWLYGAHGSTCTADVKGVKFLGQAIWRYHPGTREFEVFAEGGGNTYSLEFDAHGLAYSGSNYDNTRGLHYVQGGAYIKNWGKHGPLMNPYSFGWFEHMPSQGFKPRFAQTMIVYEGGALPAYEGQIIAPMSLVNRVQAARMIRDTSTWRTEDTDALVLTDDRWFRPVDTKVGPDGAIYLADWYDSRLSHLDPNDTWDKERGRIYRLAAVGAKPAPTFDLAQAGTAELIQYLAHSNKWFRQTALRIFHDRHDAQALPALRKLVFQETGQFALEAFWAVNASGGFDEPFALRTLDHANPFVRYWTIRLLGDARKIAPALAQKLRTLARTEPDAQVRSQLASSCKRLPAADALPIVRELMLRAEDADDVHIPLLLWWALESKCGPERERALALFHEPGLWQSPIVARFLVVRLGQRFTAERGETNLLAAARLLALAPTDAAVDELVRGMAEGLRGDAVKTVPAALREQVGRLWSTRPHTPALTSLAVRLGHAEAAQAALARFADGHTPLAERRQLLTLLAEQRVAAVVPVLLDQLEREADESFRIELLGHLQRFPDEQIPATLLRLHPGLSARLRDAVRSALCSRVAWSRQLLAAVDRGDLPREQVPVVNLLAIQNHHDPRCDDLIRRHWGNLQQSSEDKQQRIARVRRVLAGGPADLAAGRAVFQQACASCHTLFGEGGKVGPDLTGYERDNLDFLLPAVVDPSLAIREEFTAFTVTTRDDESLTGFLTENQPQSITLTLASGQKVLLARERIESLQASRVSLMPEGLLDPLTEQQLRDLFGYLARKP